MFLTLAKHNFCMNKLFTSLLLAGAVIFSGQAFAQLPQPLSNGYIRTNLNPVRFLVNSPASIGGLKRASIADWGGSAIPPLLNVPVVRGLDSLAASPLTNAAAISGKVCLLFRGGGISFAQKAQYAFAAGAVGVIIVNNIPGEPIKMGNTGTTTYTSPIVMVTNADGVAMNNILLSSGSVNVSIGSWSLATHDLGIVPGYQSTPHALSIPYSQLSIGAGRLPYRNFSGGAVANFGTSAETNISVTDTVTWMPTSGAPSVVHTGGYTVPNIGISDSVKFGFGGTTSPWSLTAPTSTGMYQYKYSLNYANTDGIPQDNTLTYNQYVTDSIFCKGLYDFTKMQPNVSSGIQPAGISTAFCMGPMYYMARGKFAAKKIQYSIYTNAATLSGEEAIALLFKWVDGANGQPIDSFAEGDELTLVGINRKTFTTTDSSGKMVTVPVLDPTIATKTVVLDSNAWYWVSLQASANCFIGMDYSTSFFTRSYIQQVMIKNNDMPELLWNDDYTNLGGSSTALLPFPFGGNAYQIDSTFFDRFQYIPALAFHISKNQIGTVIPPSTSVGSEVNTGIGSVTTFPNPAAEDFNVAINLSEHQKSVAVRLLDVTGRIVWKKDLSDIKDVTLVVPSGGLPTGNYYLAIFGDNGHIVNKVSIKH